MLTEVVIFAKMATFKATAIGEGRLRKNLAIFKFHCGFPLMFIVFPSNNLFFSCSEVLSLKVVTSVIVVITEI